MAWYNESGRHAKAAKGIKTGRKDRSHPKLAFREKLTPKGKEMMSVLEGLESALKAKGIHDPKLDDLKRQAKEVFKTTPKPYYESRPKYEIYSHRKGEKRWYRSGQVYWDKKSAKIDLAFKKSANRQFGSGLDNFEIRPYIAKERR